MKAESAAAGQRKRNKKMLESAIKIQVTHLNMYTEARRAGARVAARQVVVGDEDYVISIDLLLPTRAATARTDREGW